jgi:hypothetical protein
VLDKTLVLRIFVHVVDKQVSLCWILRAYSYIRVVCLQYKQINIRLYIEKACIFARRMDHVNDNNKKHWKQDEEVGCAAPNLFKKL